MNFPNNLRFLIDERKLTQKKLASDLKIPVSTLGGYVQGISEPDFATLTMLADYFEVSTDFLLGYNSSQSQSKENDIIKIFRSLSPNERELYLEQGKAFLKVRKNKTEKRK